MDSSVAAVLIHEAIGEQLTCIFVDHGLLRQGEADDVVATFRDRFNIKLVHRDASDLFLGALEGVTDPEIKRKTIGRLFIEVFEEEAAKVGGADFLAQGTLYPDVIESVSFTGGPSVTIKSHHNVGGLPERMRMRLVEPLRELFKDEVRALGRELGMQKEPGLAELLGRTCDPAAVIQRDSLPNLAFVSCGGPSRNPGDLFLESKLDEILAKWRREFDYVVIDSSPLFAADDASCLAPKVDGTLFVVRRGQSSARAVNEALDMLVQRQAKVLGVIFNGADASSRNYYYYKYAEYGASAKSAS